MSGRQLCCQPWAVLGLAGRTQGSQLSMVFQNFPNGNEPEAKCWWLLGLPSRVPFLGRNQSQADDKMLSSKILMSDMLWSAQNCLQPGLFTLSTSPGLQFPGDVTELQLHGDKGQQCLESPSLGCLPPGTMALRGHCCTNENVPCSVGRLFLAMIISFCLATRGLLQKKRFAKKGSEMISAQSRRSCPYGCHPSVLLSSCSWFC